MPAESSELAWLDAELPALLTAALACARCTVDISLADRRLLEQSAVCVAQVAHTCGAADAWYFCKHVDLRGLQSRMSKSPAKWRISQLSFANEAAFLKAAPFAALRRTQGLSIPRPLMVTDSGSGSASAGGDCSWTTVSAYLPPAEHRQLEVLDELTTGAAVHWLARFHAFFWTADGSPSPLAPAGIFPAGGWWRQPLRPSVKYSDIPAAFESVCTAFPELAPLATDDNRALMVLLRDNVDRLTAATCGVDGDSAATGSDPVMADATSLHGAAGTKAAAAAAAPAPCLLDAPSVKRTLVHGDFKTSNLFFKRFVMEMVMPGGQPHRMEMPVLADVDHVSESRGVGAAHTRGCRRCWASPARCRPGRNSMRNHSASSFLIMLPNVPMLAALHPRCRCHRLPVDGVGAVWRRRSSVLVGRRRAPLPKRGRRWRICVRAGWCCHRRACSGCRCSRCRCRTRRCITDVPGMQRLGNRRLHRTCCWRHVTGVVAVRPRVGAGIPR